MSLQNSQYDALMRIYARRRADSRRDLSERLESIHRDIPELSDLESALTSCQAEKVRSAVEGNKEETSDLEDRLSALKKQRSALLSSHGYTEADLEPKYVCPDCRDTGYIGTEKCHCFRQEEINLIYSQSRLEDVLSRENFSAFSYSWYDEGPDREEMRHNVRVARLFIENFDSEFQNLLFLGAVGTGKTFLSNCIARELMDSCHSVVYMTAFQLFDLLSRETFGPDREKTDPSQTYPYLFDSDLLIVDDLGMELANSFTVSQFFLCVNERILMRKATLISSNLSIKALQDTYTERTMSRILSSYTVLQFPGSDIRLKMKLQNQN